MSLRPLLPRAFPRTFPAQCLVRPTLLAPVRPFTTTPPVEQRPRMKAPPSIRVLMKDTAGSGILPKDLGMLPYTYIHPPFSRLPWFYTLTRLKLEFARVRYKLGYILETLIFKYKTPYPLELFQPRSAQAKNLYIKFYEAFAKGDLDTLRTICGAGLLEKTMRRIAARGRREKLDWSVVSWGSVKKVGSRRMHFWGQGVDIKQAVFRVKSTQRATTYVNGVPTKSGAENPPKEIEEYIVLQKKWTKGEEPLDWYVWGFVGQDAEGSLEKLAEFDKIKEMGA